MRCKKIRFSIRFKSNASPIFKIKTYGLTNFRINHKLNATINKDKKKIRVCFLRYLVIYIFWFISRKR